MKKIVSLLLCFVLVFSLTVTTYAEDSEITVTENYEIYIGEDSSLQAAAEYLNRYVNEICGFSLSINNNADAPQKYISLAVDEALDSGYAVTSDSENIFISGADLRSTVDGICGFLTKYGGIHYYTSTTVVKEKTSITVPLNEEYSYKPCFENTETDWYSPCDIDYSLFNGLSGSVYRKVPANLGGGAEYISSFCHTFTNQFCNADKYFESNPECFASFLGFRSKKEICLSNPKTLEIVTDEVFKLLEEKHDPSAALQIISLTQNDNIIFCTCPHCVAKYLKYQSISGLMIEFANSVAREVKEAGYDNVAIDTFAYMYTRSAPKNIVPDDNVIVRLCSLECCFSHALNDRSCSANIGFGKDLQDWSKICDRLYVWDYVTNFCHYIGIFPNFNVLQKNMQFFYENNVKGVYEEGNYSATACDTEFGELRAYLLTKLMQDPYCDLEAERDAFLSAYYGEGGKYIGEFLDIVSESSETEHMSIYNSMRCTCNLTCGQIKKCDDLWKSAKAAAQGEALTHVTNSELAWRYWKYQNNVSEYSNIFTRKDVRAQYDEEINAAEINCFRECPDNKAFWLGVFQKVRFVLEDVAYPLLYAINMF